MSPAFAVSSPTVPVITEPTYEIGTYIALGSYEQDNNTKSGKELSEPVAGHTISFMYNVDMYKRDSVYKAFVLPELIQMVHAMKTDSLYIMAKAACVRLCGLHINININDVL